MLSARARTLAAKLAIVEGRCMIYREILFVYVSKLPLKLLLHACFECVRSEFLLPCDPRTRQIISAAAQLEKLVKYHGWLDILHSLSGRVYQPHTWSSEAVRSNTVRPSLLSVRLKRPSTCQIVAAVLTATKPRYTWHSISQYSYLQLMQLLLSHQGGCQEDQESHTAQHL